jgi:hypothetical protein
MLLRSRTTGTTSHARRRRQPRGYQLQQPTTRMCQPADGNVERRRRYQRRRRSRQQPSVACLRWMFRFGGRRVRLMRALRDPFVRLVLIACGSVGACVLTVDTCQQTSYGSTSPCGRHVRTSAEKCVSYARSRSTRGLVRRPSLKVALEYAARSSPAQTHTHTKLSSPFLYSGHLFIS